MGRGSAKDHWLKIAPWGPQTVDSLAGIAYGSHLFDDCDPASDYDLAIIAASMPNQEESQRIKSAFNEKTGLPIDLFFATPAGIQARKNLDPMIFSLLQTGRLLWGELGEWWGIEPFAVAGVEDAIITVESLTDVGDFSDLTPGIAAYTWRLLDGAWAAWKGEKPRGRRNLPRPEEMPRSIASLRDTIRHSLNNGVIR